MKFLTLSITAVLASLLALPAHATIISGTVVDRDGPSTGDAFEDGGTFVKLTLPFNPPNGTMNTVRNDTFQTPNFYGFDEEQNVSFSSGINVNLLTSTNSAGILQPSDVADSIVASHYLFFDPDGSTELEGTVEFDSDILAISWSTDNLNNSHFLANITNPKPVVDGHGLESPDSVELRSPRELRFRARASSPGDYFRVLTEFSPSAMVPVPGTGGLLLAGLAALLLGRMRRTG